MWASEKVAANTEAAPGTVIRAEQNGIVVASGNGTALLITELQPAGKKRMKGEDFVRGKNVQSGDVLGASDEEN